MDGGNERYECARRAWHAGSALGRRLAAADMAGACKLALRAAGVAGRCPAVSAAKAVDESGVNGIWSLAG